MKRRFYQHILLFLILSISAIPCFSRPAIRIPIQVIQPDGSRLLVRLNGDEFGHFTTSVDGYLLKKNENGIYYYGIQASDGSVKQSEILARNPDDRTRKERNFLKSQPKGLVYKNNILSRVYVRKSQVQTTSSSKIKKTEIQQTIPSILLNNFPRVGNPKSLVILVNFKDKSFKAANDSTAYSNMLNKQGYNANNHVGSVRDYYYANSSGLFNPEFVVVGPITVSKNASYYGANDLNENDMAPEEMVAEACQLIDSKVDFSEFDFDKDGTVDNVYVFYAGRGEADGGGDNTIWPHSYNLSSAGISLKLDQTDIDGYACSNELSYLQTRDGMGAFTHEYGHVIGLPDMYDVDYNTYNGYGFDLNEWDLMASGSYNNNSCTPPNLSVVERYILGWCNPIIMDTLMQVNAPDFGSSNIGYKIQTDDPGEFFLMENRQQTKNVWDAYLPYHGMLIYHIDMRENDSTILNFSGTYYKLSYSDCWRDNRVNALSSHQCCDLVEADDIQTFYSGYNYSAYLLGLKGDVFPGSANVTSFSEASSPAMLTWNNTYLNKPISGISEIKDTIRFNFMDYSSFLSPPNVFQAQSITPFTFTAFWGSFENAAGYYVSVYSIDSSVTPAVRKYVPEYQNKLVSDTFLTVRVPNDFSTYYYQVMATNLKTLESPLSDSVAVTTPDGTPLIASPTLLDHYSFQANWLKPTYATGVYLDVFSLDEVRGDTIWTDGYTNIFVSNSAYNVENLEDQTTYYYQVRATDGISTSKNSTQMAATTTRATQISVYVKDGVIYLKGMDKHAEVVVYNLNGTVLLRTNSNQIQMNSPGTYVLSAFYNQTEKQFKVLVP